MPQMVKTRSSHGYVFVRIGVGEYRQEHRLIAEAAIGKPLPPNAEVHHVNYDKSDNSHTNLVICEDHAYHQLLHRRQRILEHGGDPDRDRLCCYCKQPRPKTAFGLSRNHSDSLSNICRECVPKRNNTLKTWRVGSCRDCSAVIDHKAKRCRACWKIRKRLGLYFG